MSTNALIKAFYEENKSSLGMSESEVIALCSSPFKLVKEVISSGSLKDIRLKYFGIFKTTQTKVDYAKKKWGERLEKNLATEEEYKEVMLKLNSYESRKTK